VLGRSENVPFLIEHRDLPLADTRSATLVLPEEDARGLSFVATVDREDPDGQRAVAKVRQGVMRSMSFAFIVDANRYDYSTTPKIRYVQSVKSLLDVSLVVSPAYQAASASLVEPADRSTMSTGLARRKLRLSMRDV
jgi:HK97 family phage prohead protease